MFSKVLLVLCLVVLSFGAQNDRDLFHNFLVKYNKDYKIGSQEYDLKFEIFKSNLRLIENENAKNSGFKLKINEFADLTKEERAARKGNFAKFGKFEKPASALDLENIDLPDTFSWVSTGVVGPVEEEGQCGSSYIFTVVQSIGSIYAIQHNNASYKGLSFEQVISCTTSGCNGGTSEEVVQYIQAHGLGWTFTPGQCPKGTVSNGVCVKGEACSQKGNETALAVALYTNGPLYVAIDASLNSFELYDSGVYAPTGCSTTKLDHSLLLVGYNDDAWLCQNQWGTDWGMNGYIWIARDHNNMCGIATEACYPTGVADC